MAHPFLFCLLCAPLGLAVVGASREPWEAPQEKTPRGKQRPAGDPGPDPAAPWSRPADGTVLAQQLAEEVPADVASYLHSGDPHRLRRTNCSGRYELGLPAPAGAPPALHGALDALTRATNFLNTLQQSNKSRELHAPGDLDWYRALVRSVVAAEPSVARAALTLGGDSPSAPAPRVFLQATRDQSRVLLQDLSASAHQLANATLDTEWFHGLRRKWRGHLHRRGSGQGPRGLGHSWRRRDAPGGDRVHVKWSPPYLECENGSYAPGWLVTVSAAVYGSQPDLAPEFR